MKRVTINQVTVEADEFAWDECHKIYIVTDQQSRHRLAGYGYDFFLIEELRMAWENSCGLRFISNADLKTQYVPQCFEGKVTIHNG